MKRAGYLLKETYEKWSRDDVTEYSAALAYYAIFSLAPLLLIAVVVVGLVFGQQEARQRLMAQVTQTVGPQATGMVNGMIEQAIKPGAGILASAIGIVTLLFGATRIFGQLKEMLNKIWEVKAPQGFVQGFVKGKLLAFLMVLGMGLFFLVLTVASTAMTTMVHFMGSRIGGVPWLWQIVNLIVSAGVFTLLFAMIYKWLPDLKIPWSDVWVGAAVTAVLFTIGKFLLGFYLSLGSVASPYGAAGSLVVLLVFIYYAALIFFTGAEFTQVYSSCYGSRKLMKEGAPAPAARPEPEQRAPRPRLETAPSGGKLFMGLAAFLVWRRLFHEK